MERLCFQMGWAPGSGKEEYVGLDELGDGGKGVVSKIGEFGGDLGTIIWKIEDVSKGIESSDEGNDVLNMRIFDKGMEGNLSQFECQSIILNDIIPRLIYDEVLP
ncbi:hypothetical protein Tco_0978857 [Tanacetum coccineum]|uniref:G-patch domain-containing protein n=1 Tax=Tanacetum coccineum TaxID=301880 RepID=A0ABQ5EP90_9ASTR